MTSETTASGSQETLHAMLRESARRRPDAPALASRLAHWSYSDLARAMDATAGFLRARGCEAGSRIALLFHNTPSYVAAYYGVLAAGCIVVPLNPYERASVLVEQLGRCHVRLLLGDATHPEWALVTAIAKARGIESLDIEAGDCPDAVSHYLETTYEPRSSIDFVPASGDLAAIVFTSGTTGRAKGVMLSHGNLVANTVSIVRYLGLESDDRGLLVLPLQFAYGNSVLHTHLAVGAELLLEDSIAYPHMVLQRIADEGVTDFAGVPSTFAVLMARCDLTAFDLSRLRYLTQAGGPMPQPIVRRLRECVPHARLLLMYGQTEATARLTYLPHEHLESKPGSVGIAIPGVEIAVFRSDGSNAAPLETGEIVARGPNVMHGYLDDPAATRIALRNGWLHTGDVGRLDVDGYLYVDGREGDIIKVGAFRVAPAEVEEVIAALPGISQVAVTAVPDELLGHAIKAVIVLEAGAALDVRRVKAHCRSQLTSYKIPKIVEFAGALPVTATGKVKRALLG